MAGDEPGQCPHCGAPYEWQQKMEGPVAFPTCTCEEERAERKNTRYINRIRKRMRDAEGR